MRKYLLSLRYTDVLYTAFGALIGSLIGMIIGTAELSQVGMFTFFGTVLGSFVLAYRCTIRCDLSK